MANPATAVLSATRRTGLTRMARAVCSGLVAASAFVVLGAVALADGRCGTQTCRADVGIAGHAEPQPIRVGEQSALKVTAKNNGYDGALAIDVQVDVADGLQILSVTHYGGRSCTTRGQFVRCDFGDFRREQQAVVVIAVRGTRTGTFISRGRVYASDVADPNGGNGQVAMTVGVLDGPGGGESGGGSGGGSGSGGSGSGSGGGDPSASTPGTGTVFLGAADPQRVLRTGGVRVRVRPATTGSVAVRGEVRTPAGRVRLSSVTLPAASGTDSSVFLGTTRAALRRIRAALRTRSRLRTIVWARNGSQTARRELHLRR